MSEPIQPALTAAQWASVGEWNPQPAEMSNSYLGDSVSDYDGYANERHALAALALYGQPFGFTREMLRAIKTLLANHIAEDRGRDGDTWYSDELEKLVALGQDTVGRIEALLPPEKPT